MLNKFFDLSPVSMYLLLWSREEKKIECWSTVPKINKPILHGRFLARSNGLGSRLHDRSQLAGLIPSPLYFPLESLGDIVRRCQHCHWLILQSGREREKKTSREDKNKRKDEEENLKSAWQFPPYKLMSFPRAREWTWWVTRILSFMHPEVYLY